LDYKRIIWEGSTTRRAYSRGAAAGRRPGGGDHHHRFGLAGEGQADTIQEFLERHPGTALNVGCGPWGAKLQALAPHCRVADAHHLPFCDCTFDHLLALGLFAHIPTPRPVFRELQRVCRTGGHVFVTNAVRHRRTRYERAAARAGFERVHAEEGYCPAASGEVKRRYLLVFRRNGRVRKPSRSRDVS
jgi:SAM-dependent methyltransferase